MSASIRVLIAAPSVRDSATVGRNGVRVACATRGESSTSVDMHFLYTCFVLVRSVLGVNAVRTIRDTNCMHETILSTSTGDIFTNPGIRDQTFSISQHRARRTRA